ncbi:hypothetical protein AVDCRST_MAG94-1113, partial [uncultured Leptolyngbya sp.]
WTSETASICCKSRMSRLDLQGAIALVRQQSQLAFQRQATTT